MTPLDVPVRLIDVTTMVQNQFLPEIDFRGGVADAQELHIVFKMTIGFDYKVQVCQSCWRLQFLGSVGCQCLCPPFRTFSILNNDSLQIWKKLS